MLRPALAVALLALAACKSTPPTSPSPIDRELTLAAGETADVVTGVALRFAGVSADSRCPGDAICITAGDATVRIEVTANNRRREGDLHLANRQPVSHEGVTIGLVSLEPYPFHSLPPIRPADYRATLRVRR
jgi:hypothetical protein